MTAPLTETRDNKILILREISSLTWDILLFPKGSLDRVDMRLLKKLLKNLNMLKERAKPL